MHELQLTKLLIYVFFYDFMSSSQETDQAYSTAPSHACTGRQIHSIIYRRMYVLTVNGNHTSCIQCAHTQLDVCLAVPKMINILALYNIYIISDKYRLTSPHVQTARLNPTHCYNEQFTWPRQAILTRVVKRFPPVL